jgi:hypothetical protein
MTPGAHNAPFVPWGREAFSPIGRVLDTGITTVIATRAEERHSHGPPYMQSQQLRPDPSSVLILAAPAGRSQSFFPFALLSTLTSFLTNV